MAVTEWDRTSAQQMDESVIENAQSHWHHQNRGTTKHGLYGVCAHYARGHRAIQYTFHIHYYTIVEVSCVWLYYDDATRYITLLMIWRRANESQWCTRIRSYDIRFMWYSLLRKWHTGAHTHIHSNTSSKATRDKRRAPSQMNYYAHSLCIMNENDEHHIRNKLILGMCEYARAQTSIICVRGCPNTHTQTNTSH